MAPLKDSKLSKSLFEERIDMFLTEDIGKVILTLNWEHFMLNGNPTSDDKPKGFLDLKDKTELRKESLKERVASKVTLDTGSLHLMGEESEERYLSFLKDNKFQEKLDKWEKDLEDLTYRSLMEGYENCQNLNNEYSGSPFRLDTIVV